jgi:hemoglobin/transferrin/lactoferrin receptor protein
VFANKNFPDTETTRVAAYIQGYWPRGRPAVDLIPAVRSDLYELKPMPDALFANSMAGSQVAINPITPTATSSKLGMTYDLTDQLCAFVRYAHGFRAPPYDNAIFGFVDDILGYEILPDGNLVPRTLNGHEVGWRGRDSSGSSFQVSGFYNTYKNFVDGALVTSPPPTPLLPLQCQNLASVVIYEWDAIGGWRLLPAWTLLSRSPVPAAAMPTPLPQSMRLTSSTGAARCARPTSRKSIGCARRPPWLPPARLWIALAMTPNAGVVNIRRGGSAYR